MSNVSEPAGDERTQPSDGGQSPPATVRAEGVLVGLQGLVVVGFAVFELIELGSATLGVGAVIGQAVTFLLVGLLLLAVARGLVRGRLWSRSPALMVQILLLPVGYWLAVPSHQVLPGLVVLLVGLVGLGLLLCAPSREWAEHLDAARREL